MEDTSQFHEDFIINHNKEGDKGCFLEVNVEYPENLRNVHNDLLFLTKRMKI